MLEVGWPDPALVEDRIESTRSCAASSAMVSRRVFSVTVSDVMAAPWVLLSSTLRPRPCLVPSRSPPAGVLGWLLPNVRTISRVAPVRFGLTHLMDAHVVDFLEFVTDSPDSGKTDSLPHSRPLTASAALPCRRGFEARSSTVRRHGR